MGVLRVWNGSGWDEIKGERGDTGASAYQIAVNEGFVGTEEEWLESLAVDPADIESAVNTAIDAEPRVAQLVTDTNALTTSMATVEPIAERVSTQRYDVRAYGPIGTSNDSATFQAAIDAVNVAGGGTVTGPAGFYSMLNPIQLYDGVTIAMPFSGSTVFDFAGATTGIDSSMIYGTGSLTALPTRISALVPGATLIRFTAAHGLVPGDWILIDCSTDYSFMGERPSYRDGQYARVASVSGNNVTLAEPLVVSVPNTSAWTMHKLTPMRTGVSGVSIMLPSNKRGITFDLATQTVMNDVYLEGSAWSHIHLKRCVNVVLNNITVFSVAPTDSAGINYGVAISNSQHIYLDNCILEVGRHGFTTGGGNWIGSVPNRFISVRGGKIGSTLNEAIGCDLHANSEYVWFSDVDMPSGLHLAGDHLAVKGGVIRSSQATGAALSIGYLLGMNVDVDTKVVATRSVKADANVRGLVGVFPSFHCTRGGQMRLNIQAELGAWRSADASATQVVWLGSTLSVAQSARVEVTLQASATGVTPGNSVHGVFVETTGTVKWDEITVRDCNLQSLGISLQNSSANRAVLESNTVVAPPNQGIVASNVLTVFSKNNTVLNAGSMGIQYIGPGKATAMSIISSDGDTALECNESSGTSSTLASGIHIRDSADVVYRNALVGDRRTTPKQLRSDALFNIGTLTQGGNATLGSVTTNYRSAIDVITNV